MLPDKLCPKNGGFLDVMHSGLLNERFGDTLTGGKTRESPPVLPVCF
jgi:hypothetical protein